MFWKIPSVRTRVTCVQSHGFLFGNDSWLAASHSLCFPDEVIAVFSASPCITAATVHVKVTLLQFQTGSVLNKVENFRNKAVLIVHGTADGNTHTHTHTHTRRTRLQTSVFLVCQSSAKNVDAERQHGFEKKKSIR